MLESVRGYLSSFGKIGEKEEDILKAMKFVDRANFVEPDFKNGQYLDIALPTKDGQTISQPSTVARMLQLLDLKKGDKVLEVGAGSGWNAGLIGFLAGESGHVLSLEIVDFLVKKARKRIQILGVKNIEIKNIDFRKLNDVKFDKIIFTAGISSNQNFFILDYAKKHLVKNGILICPHKLGSLIILKRKEGKFEERYTKEQYSFVPLILD